MTKGSQEKKKDTKVSCCGRKSQVVTVEPDETNNHENDHAYIQSIRDRNNSAAHHGKGSKCRYYMFKLFSFVFSYFGLGGIIVGYALLGALLFQHLEQEGEMLVRKSVKSKSDHYVGRLWEVTDRYNMLDQANWTIAVKEIIEEFQYDIVKAVKEDGFDGRNVEDAENTSVWNMANSLLYAVTIITTIGYGNVAPKTAAGKIATMLYAIIGIPLTLIFLANIGGVLGNIFRMVYYVICRILSCLCFCFWGKNKNNKQLQGKGNKSGNYHDPNDTSGQNEPPDSLKSQHSEMKKTKDEEETVKIESETDLPYVTDLERLDEDEEYEIPKDVIRVPVWVTLFVMFMYIMLGAVVFASWEEDWDFLIAAYFCFVTLSTIGFGDFVFGTGIDHDEGGKVIFGMLYLVMGLSMISMCFDLMQEEVRYKFKEIAKKSMAAYKHDNKNSTYQRK